MSNPPGRRRPRRPRCRCVLSRSSSRIAVRIADRRPRRALGIVFVGLRNAEGGEHGVAGELLDDATVHRHAVGDTVEELGHPAADDLRIGARDELRRVDDVDEQNRRQLSLYVAAHHVIVRTPSRATDFRHSIRPVLNPAVFKAYDVRGIYPDDLDEEGAYAIGRAYVEQFEPRRIAVGRDMRLSSPSMASAAMDGAADGGADVLDIGMVGTEMLYCAVGELELEGGIAVTASHNPKEYTGMKIVRRGALPVGGDSGLLDIRDRALAWLRRGKTPWARASGTTADIWPAFVERVLSFVDVEAHQAAPHRDRRRERDGRRHAAAGARAPAGRGRHVLLRAGRELPEPRAEPAAAGESRVHHAEDAGGERRLRRRVRRGRGPLLLRGRHGRVRPRRLRDRPLRRGCARKGTRREDHLRRPGELGRTGDRRAARAVCR